MNHCRRIADAVPRISVAVLGLATWLTCSLSSEGEDWPFFRGPHYNGISSESGWTFRWRDGEPRVAWNTNVGIGVSSFAVVGDRVVTMGSPKGEDAEVVSCLDASSGQLVWKHSYPCKFDARQFEGGPAATPTIDGGLVCALGYLGHLHCFDLSDGEVVWSKHLVDDFGGRYSSWK